MEETTEFHTLDKVPLQDIVKEEYRIYQIYTLMDRAIPYLADGLKPGQRRILYTLWKHRGKGLMKVSSATGLVLTLHPHGPASVESTIVNLAQDYTFSNNYPLIAKKGYFGERMETKPAASRYIECKIGKIADIILFDDMNQVEMIPNYDEKAMEPLFFLPKLPTMLLNGAEGIGTGFSSVIPSFHHKDIVASMIQYVQTGKAKKIKPFSHHYDQEIQIEKSGKLIFHMRFEQKGEKIFITELPRGYDATKTYRFLNKHIDDDFIKDYIDSSVDNTVNIELLFKRGKTPSLKEVRSTMMVTSAQTPNYTLISERGVRIFTKVQEIIEIFTDRRLEIVKRRYELLCEECKHRINQNAEIIRFIKEKQYEKATKSKNRKTFVDHLKTKKYKFFDYLADMPIYRMTKDEVERRKLLVKEDKASFKKYEKVAKSKRLVKKKLIEELNEVKEDLNKWLKDKKGEADALRKKIDKANDKELNKSKKKEARKINKKVTKKKSAKKGK